jgi:hypothetical protein
VQGVAHEFQDTRQGVVDRDDRDIEIAAGAVLAACDAAIKPNGHDPRPASASVLPDDFQDGLEALFLSLEQGIQDLAQRVLRRHAVEARPSAPCHSHDARLSEGNQSGPDARVRKPGEEHEIWGG